MEEEVNLPLLFGNSSRVLDYLIALVDQNYFFAVVGAARGIANPTGVSFIPSTCAGCYGALDGKGHQLREVQ